MDKRVPIEYINANFRPDDRLAVVLINKATGDAKQRLAFAARIASGDFQAWLRFMNRERYEVYLSVNCIHEHARGRAKEDIAHIRHIYLDFDDRGDEGVGRLRERVDIPVPNHLLQTSPGKWQAIWRVEGFSKGQDEALMQGLVRDLGADKAVHDCARVLRLPGYINHKYNRPHWVTVQNLSEEIYRPDRFPQYAVEQASVDLGDARRLAYSRSLPTGHLSQSERDWSYAKRALARGDDPQAVMSAIATFRTDKPDPHYYAELTVKKALQTFPQQETRSRDGGGAVERG